MRQAERLGEGGRRARLVLTGLILVLTAVCCCGGYIAVAITVL